MAKKVRTLVLQKCVEIYSDTGAIPNTTQFAEYIEETTGRRLHPAAIRRAIRQLCQKGLLVQLGPQAPYVPASAAPLPPLEVWTVSNRTNAMGVRFEPSEAIDSPREALALAIAGMASSGWRVEDCRWTVEHGGAIVGRFETDEEGVIHEEIG